MTQVEQTTGEETFPLSVQRRLVVASCPYLVTGSHAAFQYHRWLFPTPGVSCSPCAIRIART